MFKSLENISTALKLAKISVIAVCIVSLVIVGIVSYMCFSFAREQVAKIYVLDGEKSLMLALSQDVQQNRLAEARSHVKRFHEYFFTLSPTAEAIEHNVGEALKLSDNSALTLYNAMVEKGYYDKLIAASMSTEIMTDSVVIDASSYPFKAVYYGKTSLIRSKSVTYRRIITQCELINCTRSDDNPHGFILEKLKIINNEDIRTIKRD